MNKPSHTWKQMILQLLAFLKSNNVHRGVVYYINYKYTDIIYWHLSTVKFWTI